MTFKLHQSLAASGRADGRDVRAVKTVLNRLGYYAPPKDIGITDIPDRAMFTALKNFQKDSGLRASGEIRPGDATVDALNAAEEEQKNSGEKYIWHTVGDDKVRDSHAALEGTVRSWDESPVPGEEENCRCWAELKPAQGEYIIQTLISSIDDAPAWNDIDFIRHFLFGGGNEVTLPQIGYLGAVIGRAEQDIYPNVEEQILEVVRGNGEGSFSYDFHNSYDFGDIIYSLGGGSLSGQAIGSATKIDDYLQFEGYVYYEFGDEFTDVANIREIITGSSSPEEATELELQLTEFGGTAYPIIGSWTTKIEGVVEIEN